MTNVAPLPTSAPLTVNGLLAAVGNPTMGVTQDVWAAILITQINANGGNVPLTWNNVNNITRWMVAEEPPSHWWNRWNPLNASLGTSASDGTGSYPNLMAAANYTAKMILQKNMNGIYSALAADAPTSVFSAAVVGSPWASSHYGGDPQHIAKIGLPVQVSAGTGAKVLPPDPGAAVAAPPTPNPLVNVPNLPGVLDPIKWADALGQILGDLLSADWWKRVGLFAAGLVLVIGGTVLFISTTKTGERVESDAMLAAAA